LSHVLGPFYFSWWYYCQCKVVKFLWLPVHLFSSFVVCALIDTSKKVLPRPRW
jgi:hypothetical protein